MTTWVVDASVAATLFLDDEQNRSYGCTNTGLDFVINSPPTMHPILNWLCVFAY